MLRGRPCGEIGVGRIAADQCNTIRDVGMSGSVHHADILPGPDQLLHSGQSNRPGSEDHMEFVFHPRPLRCPQLTLSIWTIVAVAPRFVPTSGDPAV